MSMLAVAASGGAVPKLYVEDVFSTYVYTGNGSTQTINNGIDLAGEGGMVWIKSRTAGYSHRLFDTIRGKNYALSTDLANENAYSTAQFTSFNSNGFTLGSEGFNGVNTNNQLHTSWTFRKAPKFFDIITWVGDNTATGRVIPHTLAQTVGIVTVKATSTTSDWYTWHRATTSGNYLKLNTTAAQSSTLANTYFGNGTTTVDPTSTGITVGLGLNVTGVTYIAYLYAHDTSTDGIIQCGSYVGNGTEPAGTIVNLGFEPQYVMIKSSSTAGGDWCIFDNMRGVATGGQDYVLHTNESLAEGNSDLIDFNATGFQVTKNFIDVNSSGTTYIYMAIRRPNKVPTSGTEVYNTVTLTPTANLIGTKITSNFIVDMSLSCVRNKTGIADTRIFSRLQGKTAPLVTNSTSAEGSFSDPYNIKFDYNDGVLDNFYYPQGSVTSNVIYNSFKRAKGFMTITAHTDLTSSDVIAHDLGVTPEMIWAKCRSTAEDWFIYHKDLTSGYTLKFTTAAEASDASRFTSLSATQFTYGGGTAARTRIFYSFATLAGISKVFTFTADVSKTINCGFTTGARFIMLKKKNGTGSFYIWDSVRGIVSGNDPYLLLDSTAAEVTSTDLIDPEASGFISNFTDGSVYVGYAIS